jgi:hypothetical protein
MQKNKLIVIVFLILLTLSQLLFLNQVTYAEESQQFQGYNSDFNFKTDYEYKFLEYSFLTGENKLNLNNNLKNSAYISQNGNLNQGLISQIGNFGSLVEIVQIGNENRASVNQYANNTSAEIFQFGDNHDLSIEQWGNESKIYVIQSGNNFENKEIKIVQF